MRAAPPYGDVIQEHFRHPRNYGSLDAPDVRNEGFNPFCGDRVRIELSLEDGAITAARFQGDLCMISKAASSLLTEMLEGLPLDRVGELDEGSLLKAMHADIRPARMQCVRLPLETLRTGIEAWRNR
jgi:nitrogen fixation NifU-like protein